MDNKTLADIGHNAWYLCNAPEGLPAIPLSSRAPEYQEAWHVAADAIRDEVIETCIAVVAQGVQWKPEENFSDNWRKAARQTSFHLAEALRSLKRSDKENGDV